jgi:hypothetical protein
MSRLEAARKAFGDKGNLLLSLDNPAAGSASPRPHLFRNSRCQME